MWTFLILVGLIWLVFWGLETFVGPVERARRNNYINNAAYRLETEHMMEDALSTLREASAGSDELVSEYEAWREKGRQKRRERRQRMRENNLAHRLAMEERKKT